MDKDRVQEIVKYFKDRLADSRIAAEVILFGSHNGGTPREDSDVDLLIISNAFEGKDIFERSAMTRTAKLAAVRKFVVPLDIINLTPEEFEEDPAYAQMVAGE